MYEAVGGRMYCPIDKRVSLRDAHKFFLISHLLSAFDRGDLVVAASSKAFNVSKGGRSRPQPISKPPVLAAVTSSSPPPNRVEPSSFGVTSLSLPNQIAPGAESIPIAYTLRDPFHRIREAVLEVWRKGGANPIWERRLTPEERTDGRHQIDWDGKIDTRRFPNGYLTLAASPYQVILRVAGEGTARPERQQSIVEVKLSQITVALAPRSTLKEKRDQNVYDQIKALPAGKCRLFLKSNLYAAERNSVDEKERYGDLYDDTGYAAYRDLWEEGPRIPVVATVLLKDSQGKEVRAGKALYGSRILWDYVDLPGPPRECLSNKASAYIKRAVDYECDCSRPKGGGNAHCDFGGKRMSRAGKAKVFTEEDGKTDSGFSCTICQGKGRWWSAFSLIEAEGEGQSQGKVLFRPSRMAGDRYDVAAYLEVREGELDGEEAPKGAPQARVGEFEIWREITLAKHLRKSDAITGPLPAVDRYFDDAFIKVDNKMGEGSTLTQEEYDAAFERAVLLADLVDDRLVSPLVKKYLLVPGSQYNAGTKRAKSTAWVATIRTHDQFRKAIQHGEGWSGHELEKELARDMLTVDKAYYSMANLYVFTIAQKMGSYLAQDEGITIIQFDWLHSLEEKLYEDKKFGRLLGMATLNTREKSGFVCFHADAVTLAHELGHCLFLPHAPNPLLEKASEPGGVEHSLHDAKDYHCMMSYARETPGFCGLCLLRLRGWDYMRLNQHGPIKKS